MSVTLDRDGAVAVLTLNKPEKLNALDHAMRSELADRAAQVQADPAVRAVVLTGAGRAFCAGGDIAAMSARPDPGAARTWMRSANAATLALLAIEKPLIVAVNGVAAGVGFSITLTGDVRLAATGSRMIASFANVGLVPDGGGLWLLSRMVGLHRAKEMFLFAETLDATQAQRLGLVREIHPPDELLAAAMAMAHRFAEGPTRAFGLGKALAHRSVSGDLESYLELEIAHQTLAMGSADHLEGITAFQEKRAPRFPGR
ncbi:enoyl-CoA hydratase-related protein [Pseudonocardia petroleophila]|uniref:Enoyl-CoA hydratase/isomerase family protein n=1 Tax=Pseudonocardia petroleophila TaxID=37331 RepID=A0A7G7MBX4_9PSEU|nr:enoyl-CoA hydratase-related protein [Pseudonocardia petroleophila]QNG50285.1 enoyl-CoA hydratase/isomerase family protein [Pseudonocardia petroleophila]